MQMNTWKLMELTWTEPYCDTMYFLLIAIFSIQCGQSVRIKPFGIGAYARVLLCYEKLQPTLTSNCEDLFLLEEKQNEVVQLFWKYRESQLPSLT